MKRLSKILISFLLITSFSYISAQDTNEKIKELKALVQETIIKECNLTELSQNDEIKIDKNKIIIGINFNNGSLRSFWSPEVAVQYIFDAALYNIINTIWNTNIVKYKNFNKIIFKVDIRPHDIPPLISFEIKFKDWNSYKNGGKKENLYKKMTITAEGRLFKFDPHEAVDIE